MLAEQRRTQAPKTGAQERRQIYQRLGTVLWRFRRRTAAALLLLIAAKIFAVLTPVALKYIVDGLSGANTPLALPVFLLLGYALLRFAATLFTELRDLAFIRVTQTAVAEFTLHIFNHLQRLHVKHHGTQQTGVFARDVSRGAAGIGFLLGTALFTVLPTIIEMATVVVILLSAYRLGFAGILALTFIAYGVYTVVFTERRIKYQRQLNELDSAASGHLVDSLINYEAIKVYTGEHRETERLQEVMNRWIGVGLQNQRALSTLHIGQSGIIAFGVGATMLLAGIGVVGGEMAVGDLVLVNAYVIQVCLPLNTLGLIFRQAREALIDAERMAALLRLSAEPGAHDQRQALALRGGAIAFEHVDFSYDPSRRILHDVSFYIEPGQHVAVVGGSGSGKSTLARLLLGFYDVDAGRILVDGQELSTVSQSSLRQAIGVVPQDASLFNNTIAYNIAYGQPAATLSNVIDAAKAARIHELILSLPEQYNTPVGERGLKLSGGERQRIAIARALLKNPSILIFDEATSALDTHTEHAIQQELDQLAEGRTTLIVAHRLSTVVDADCILVMEQGRIIERGRHQSLLAAKGRYAQLWKLQRQESALSAATAAVARQPINLMAMVASVLDALRAVVAERKLVLYPVMRAEGARVTGDPSVLQRLLFDMFDNAIAFTPAGGRIEVLLERVRTDIVLSITDSRYLDAQSEAITLSEDASRVALLDPARASSILADMHGQFRAHTSDDGTGMVLTMSMPMRAVASTDQTRLADVSDSLVSLNNQRIFIVDDQSEALELIAEVLQEHGAQTTTFTGGTDVLTALRERATQDWPHVLICDLSLGTPDGYRVIATIRDIEAQRNTPLRERLPAIALSGYSEMEDRLRALLAGFQVYVTKPVDPRELLATVVAVLGAQH